MAGMTLDEFATVVFVHNKEDKHLALAADLTDTKDCFCFCLDLLCKGLVILYGKEDTIQRKKTVDLDSLDSSQLEFIKGRMSLCGIKVHTRVVPLSVFDELGIPHPTTQKIELPDVEAAQPSDPLESYKVDIFTQGLHIQLCFELTPIAAQRFAKGCHHGASPTAARL